MCLHNNFVQNDLSPTRFARWFMLSRSSLKVKVTGQAS